MWYADELEKAALNAMPGAFLNGSMWSLMYFQQINKLDAMDGGAENCEHGCTYCYGMVYECCVANHMQGWPKFAARQWAIGQSPGKKPTLALTQYFPSSIANIDVTPGSTVSVNISTAYPFSSDIKLSVAASGPFTLELRIPGWCSNATFSVGGGKARQKRPKTPVAAGTMLSIAMASGQTAVMLTLPMAARLVPASGPAEGGGASGAGSVAVMRGPLLYAALRTIAAHDHAPAYDDAPGLLPVGQPHGQDNYLLGGGEWRHALHAGGALLEEERPSATVEQLPPLGQGVFSSALVPGPVVVASAVVLSELEWGERTNVIEGDSSRPCGNTTSLPSYQHTVAAAPPGSPVNGGSGTKTTSLRLIPYGATDLRVAVFPTAGGPLN